MPIRRLTAIMNGRQFIVISVVVDPGSEPELVALTLPAEGQEPGSRDEN